MRARSRSPAVAVGTPLQDVGRRLNEALDRYKKVKAEKRAGKDFQRRRKSLVLTILEYYIHLVQIGVAASNGDRKYIRRLNQAQETFRLAKEENKLPLRSEPILPRVEDDDDLESHCAESVYQPLSEDEQELEQDFEGPLVPQGASESSSVVPVPIASSVTGRPAETLLALPKAIGSRPVFSRLSQNLHSAPSVLPDPPKKAKPVLKTTSKGSLHQKAIPPVVLQTTPKVRAAAALQTTPEAFSLFPIVVRDTEPIDWHYLDANRVELYSAQGQRIRPASRIDLGGTAVSLDFHQVLDTSREGSYATYPTAEENGVPAKSRAAIDRLNRLGFSTLVTSYVHSNWRRDCVLNSSRTLPVRYILITREPTGQGGKADSLARIFTVGRDRSIIHVDDKKEICVEFKRYWNRDIGIAHIQVPRKPRPEGVKSFKNVDRVAEALEQEKAAQAGYHRR